MINGRPNNLACLADDDYDYDYDILINENRWWSCLFLILAHKMFHSMSTGNFHKIDAPRPTPKAFLAATKHDTLPEARPRQNTGHHNPRSIPISRQRAPQNLPEQKSLKTYPSSLHPWQIQRQPPSEHQNGAQNPAPHTPSRPNLKRTCHALRPSEVSRLNGVSCKLTGVPSFLYIWCLWSI